MHAFVWHAQKDQALPVVFLMAFDVESDGGWCKAHRCGGMAAPGGSSSCGDCSGLFGFLQLG
jgi:hypothetical protein